MNKFLHLLIISLITVFVHGQAYHLSFVSFEESSGDQRPLQSTTMPRSEVVILNNSLNSRSALGPTMNFHGNVVVVDEMNRLPDGSVQIIIRREDGQDFFGYLPNLKAILRPVEPLVENGNLISN